MGRFLIQLGIFLVITISVFSTRAWGQIGSIDAPQFEDVVAGNSVFGGWAMDSTAPVTNVEILIDGTGVGPSHYGGNRVDACNAIGNYPGCPNVGWTVVFDVTALPDGPHMLKVVLTTSDDRQSSMIRAFIVDNAQQGLDATTTYQIVSRATGHVLDVTSADSAAGANIQEYQYLGAPNQLWTIYPTDDGNYTFESLSSSKVLTAIYSVTANGALIPPPNGTRVQQYEDYGGTYQEWTMVAAGDGSYALCNVDSGRSLDLQGGSSANGTPIQVYDYLGNANQNWRFVPVVAPPSGLFGSGGSVGENSPPPQINLSDILFSTETSSQAKSFAQPANGPACQSAGALVLSFNHYCPAKSRIDSIV